MSGKPILTAVSSGTTENPSPIPASRSASPRREGAAGSAARSVSSGLRVTPRLGRLTLEPPAPYRAEAYRVKVAGEKSIRGQYRNPSLRNLPFPASTRLVENHESPPVLRARRRRDAGRRSPQPPRGRRPAGGGSGRRGGALRRSFRRRRPHRPDPRPLRALCRTDRGGERGRGAHGGRGFRRQGARRPDRDP